MISCLGFVLEKMKHQNNMMTTAWPHLPRFPSRDQQDFVISFPRGDHSNPCHMAIGDWVCDPQTYICGVTPRLNQPRNNIYNACDLAMFPPLWCKQTLKHDRLPVSHSKSNEISDLTHGWLFAVKSQDIYLYFRMKAMNQSFSSTKTTNEQSKAIQGYRFFQSIRKHFPQAESPNDCFRGKALWLGFNFIKLMLPFRKAMVGPVVGSREQEKAFWETQQLLGRHQFFWFDFIWFWKWC